MLLSKISSIPWCIFFQSLLCTFLQAAITLVIDACCSNRAGIIDTILIKFLMFPNMSCRFYSQRFLSQNYPINTIGFLRLLMNNCWNCPGHQNFEIFENPLISGRWLQTEFKKKYFIITPYMYQKLFSESIKQRYSN